MSSDPSDLIRHVRSLKTLECANCSNVNFYGDDGTTAALIAQREFDAGWRVQDGEPLCPGCVALLSR